MSYFKIRPEVAGQIGEGSILDTSVRPMKVERLVYEVGWWLGDGVITSHPCFLVAVELEQVLRERGLTGFSFDEATIVKEEQTYDEDFARIPEFRWLKIHGTPLVDDFWITKQFRLAVSQAGLEALRQCQLDHAEIEEVSA